MAHGFSRDRWYNYIAERSHPPVASAVVEKPEYDPDHVYAWKPAENYKGWKLIAKGEAGVDDASVIQSALNNAATSGRGKVFIKKQEYVLTPQLIETGFYLGLILRSDTILESDGATIKIADGVDVGSARIDLIGVVDDIYNVVVDGLIIDLNKNNITAEYGSGIRFSKITTLAKDITIKNCKVMNTIGGGIVFHTKASIRSVVVDSCICEYTQRAGIMIGAGVVYATIINNVCRNVIGLNAGPDAYGEDQYEGAGIWVGDGASQVTIFNNRLYDNDYHGIQIGGARKIAVTGNIIENNGAKESVLYGGGISIIDGSEISIVSNTIMGQKSGMSGITIYRDSKKIKIVGNEIIGNTGKGIYISYSSYKTDVAPVNISIGFNDIIGNTSKGIEMLGKAGGPHVASVKIIGNDIKANGTYGIGIYYADGILYNNNTIEDNPDGDIDISNATFLKNSGSKTFSGDGSTTQFSIEHGLVSTPSKVQVTPMSSDAAGDFYVTADDTYIYINYKTAPPSGTDNVKVSWYAEV